MADPPGLIVAYGGSSAPSGYLLCDGSTFDSDTYPDLATVVGDTYGTHSGTTYYLPDLRQRFALCKAASGTGSTLGGTGGAIDHTHGGITHGHTMNQPSDHTAHTPTNPGAHCTLTHSGAAITAHAAMPASGAHTGLAVANHTISSEAGTHSNHTTDGAHTHDAHTTVSKASGSGSTPLVSPATHSSVGGHAHGAHGTHSGSTIDAHTTLITVATAHSGDTHSVTNPNDHTTPGHSGMTVTGAHTHANMALQSDSTATGGNNPPFQVSTYIIKT